MPKLNSCLDPKSGQHDHRERCGNEHYPRRSDTEERYDDCERRLLHQGRCRLVRGWKRSADLDQLEEGLRAPRTDRHSALTPQTAMAYIRRVSGHVLLLTGGLATGKTAVAREVVAAAADLSLRVAAIDLDWLGWAAGATLGVDELIGRNLMAIAANYTRAGIDNLVLARAVLSPSSLQDVREALPEWDLMVVRLDASRATLERRIRARDSGAELGEHLAEIDEFTALAIKTVPSAPVVLNEERPLRDVALEVMRLARWINV